MNRQEAVTTSDANAVDARTIVELIRAQSWKNGGVLLVDEADAVRLVATALRVAEDRGVIDGMERMGAIADETFAPDHILSP
jgi:hypothetical protein